MSSYPHFSEVSKYDDIKFPITFSDIKNFEKINNSSVNIYGKDNEKSKNTTRIVPFYLSQVKLNLSVIHLLMIENTLVDANDDDYISEDEINISK